MSDGSAHPASSDGRPEAPGSAPAEAPPEPAGSGGAEAEGSPGAEAEGSGGGRRPPGWGLTALLFSVAGLLLYAPALDGQFIGDDLGYVVNNVYIHTFDWAHAVALLDPFGDAALFTLNYAPVHNLISMVEYRLFGLDPTGYHVVNVVLHALTSATLVLFLRRTGVTAWGAWALGALFLVHPANVEAVAWIFQLKTILCLLLALAALLAFERAPLLATLLFGLALLSKIAALFALPVLVVWLWARRESAPARWAWVGAWVVVLALCAYPEFVAFDRGGHAHTLERYDGTAEKALSMVSIAGRYLAMAATSWGVSTSHEPPVTRSVLDPWFLVGLAGLLAIGARALWTLARRKEEALYWAWAAAAYAPVSQVFPFLYPMADRYLYVILPGLMGGTFLAVRDALAARQPGPAAAPRRPVARAALAGAALLGVAFAVHAVDRAGVWRNEWLMATDAARNYPDGTAARFLRARHAAQEGDVETAFRELEALSERGFERFEILQVDPTFAFMARDPRFQPLLMRLARNWVAVAEQRTRHTQPELRTLAFAYLTLGERAKAREALESALEQGGPLDDVIRQELAELKASAS